MTLLFSHPAFVLNTLTEHREMHIVSDAATEKNGVVGESQEMASLAVTSFVAHESGG